MLEQMTFEPKVWLDAVTKATNVSAWEIKSDTRTPRVVRARHLYWACIREVGKWSYPEIGHYVGRNHTSIMHGIKNVPKEAIDLVRELV